MMSSRTEDTLWGLGVAGFHDAWWRSQGVECVTASTPWRDLRQPELYLLIEKGQLVRFDLSAIVNIMMWNMATVSRLTIYESSGESYDESLMRDEAGAVTHVARRYSARNLYHGRVFLTTSRELARSWAEAESSRDARRFLTQSQDGSLLGRERVTGRIFDARTPEESSEFLEWLVATWDWPQLAIEGIRQIRPGVYCRSDSQLEDDCLFVPPVWLGDGTTRSNGLMVGPKAAFDVGDLEQEPVSILEIPEIALPPTRRSGQFVGRTSLYQTAKRGIDFAISLVLGILMIPVLLIVALAVVIDDGFPIFFGHRRQCKGGVEFRCWKFRTMRRDAEAMVAQFSQENLADGPQVNIQNDPRVTRIGKLLRALQLDELPQLWNVLVGEMSLVGPRPSPDRENQFCPAWREMRLSVRPGITGLWQVERTRSPGEDFQEWIKYDIAYVREASLMLDFKILVKTAINIVRRP